MGGLQMLYFEVYERKPFKAVLLWASLAEHVGENVGQKPQPKFLIKERIDIGRSQIVGLLLVFARHGRVRGFLLPQQMPYNTTCMTLCPVLSTDHTPKDCAPPMLPSPSTIYLTVALPRAPVAGLW